MSIIEYEKTGLFNCQKVDAPTFFNMLSETDALAIAHAIDFTSMELANSLHSQFCIDVYYRTKKDVFEYQEKTAKEALQHPDVKKFTAIHFNEIYHHLDNLFPLSDFHIYELYTYVCIDFFVREQTRINNENKK